MRPVIPFLLASQIVVSAVVRTQGHLCRTLSYWPVVKSRSRWRGQKPIYFQGSTFMWRRGGGLGIYFRGFDVVHGEAEDWRTGVRHRFK